MRVASTEPFGHPHSGVQCQVVGWREGQWFKDWEETIRDNVLRKVVVEDVLLEPPQRTAAAIAAKLDGYEGVVTSRQHTSVGHRIQKHTLPSPARIFFAIEVFLSLFGTN